jgi:hypothetical protein
MVCNPATSILADRICRAKVRGMPPQPSLPPFHHLKYLDKRKHLGEVDIGTARVYILPVIF